jgi:D-alanine-D-alanine ligase-like ATP-grasp enzyme
VATFDIRQSKVVTITPLHSDYHDEFYKMTNHYMETQNDTLDFTDSVYDDIEDQLQEMDDESFDELMNRIKNIGPNRKLH